MIGLAFNPRDIGGGVVRRLFTNAGKVHRSGDKLTGDQIRAMPTHNMRALVENRFIEIYPQSVSVDAGRHVIHRGQGRYDVIEGCVLNDQPLSKDDADKLAAVNRQQAAA